MSLPHKISTLLYCFNERNEVLLIERAQEPNLGCWSPPGGKLKTDIGESPFACACREAQEEMGFESQPENWHLTGMVSERGYQEQAHWLMFLFEYQFPLPQVPPKNREGRFEFVARSDISSRTLPPNDDEFIWPAFWKHRGGFFSAHCRCHSDRQNEWRVEASQPNLMGYLGS